MKFICIEYPTVCEHSEMEVEPVNCADPDCSDKVCPHCGGDVEKAAS